MSKVYLAQPMTGLESAKVFYCDDAATELLKDHHTVLSPLAGKDFLRREEVLQKTYNDNPLSNQHAIFERDTWMVSQCDILLCVLKPESESESVSIGCCMELAIGAALKKHTVVVMKNDGVYDHPFIREAADVVFDNIPDAIQYINLLP